MWSFFRSTVGILTVHVDSSHFLWYAFPNIGSEWCVVVISRSLIVESNIFSEQFYELLCFCLCDFAILGMTGSHVLFHRQDSRVTRSKDMLIRDPVRYGIDCYMVRSKQSFPYWCTIYFYLLVCVFVLFCLFCFVVFLCVFFVVVCFVFLGWGWWELFFTVSVSLPVSVRMELPLKAIWKKTQKQKN